MPQIPPKMLESVPHFVPKSVNLLFLWFFSPKIALLDDVTEAEQDDLHELWATASTFIVLFILSLFYSATVTLIKVPKTPVFHPKNPLALNPPFPLLKPQFLPQNHNSFCPQIHIFCPPNPFISTQNPYFSPLAPNSLFLHPTPPIFWPKNPYFIPKILINQLIPLFSPIPGEITQIPTQKRCRKSPEFFGIYFLNSSEFNGI